MSTELPPGSVNLEDDGPPIEAPPPAPPAVEPPPAEPPVAATEQEIQQAGGDAAKAGLLAALRAERENNRTLRQQATQFEQLQQEYARIKPAADFLLANPHVMQRPQEAAPPPPPPSADPDAVEAAQLMDFYKTDGTLDAERGAKWLALQDRRSGRMTAEAVKPFQQQTLQERSTANFGKALQLKDANGDSPSPEALRAVWQALPMEDTANPQIAATMAMLALGAERMTKKNGPAAPLTAPAITEASGGNPQAAPKMSRIEETIAANRGVAAAAWAEQTKDFQRGRPNQLED